MKTHTLAALPAALPAVLVAAGLALSACASNSTEWTRPGATAEDIKRDSYWCTRTTRDKFYKMGDKSESGKRTATRAVNAECMKKRGYKQVKK